MRPGSGHRLCQGVPIVLVGMVMCVVLLMASRVIAHKVNVFAWVEGDTVFVEGYFGGGKKAQNALVEVLNRAGTKLAEGRTNEKGEFSFRIPERTDLRIVLTASMGHKNDFTIPASDLGEVARAATETQEDRQTDAGAMEPKSVASEADLHFRGMSPRELEAIIDRALERKLAPVVKLIRTCQKQGPTFTEIVGGIGYVFGLMGVAIYFRNRKRANK